MKHCLPILFLAASSALAEYVQHVAVDLEDARANFPLRVARGENVELSVDFFDGGEALDIAGHSVALYTQTNGMPATVAWRTTGEARGSSAVFRLDVDAVLPEPSGKWSVTVTDGTNIIARAGGAAYIRGTAAAVSSAVPVNVLEEALAPYATTNYVAAYVASHGGGGLEEEAVRGIAENVASEKADITVDNGDGSGYTLDSAGLRVLFNFPLQADVSVTDNSGAVVIVHRLSEKANKADLANKLDKAKKELHADSKTNIVWQTCYENGWVFLRAYTNDLEVAQ